MDNILVRTAQFQPAARARRFFCFFLRAARLRAVFLRFFARMAVSYRLGELGAVLGDVVDHRPPVPRRTTARSVTGASSGGLGGQAHQGLLSAVPPPPGARRGTAPA